MLGVDISNASASTRFFSNFAHSSLQLNFLCPRGIFFPLASTGCNGTGSFWITDASNTVFCPLPFPPTLHGTLAVMRPQEQVITTGKSHLKSGQGAKGWQRAWQVCLQSLLGAPQTCPHEHFAPPADPELELEGVSHGGRWQVLVHACIPHCRVLPHSWLHLMSLEPQRMFLSSKCPPTHSFTTGIEQGGQSPKWQVCEDVCPHGWGTWHGRVQVGGGVPHGSGGGMNVSPQAQVRSLKMVSMQGGQ